MRNPLFTFPNNVTDHRRPTLFSKDWLGDGGAVGDRKEPAPKPGRIDLKMIADPQKRVGLVIVGLKPEPGKVLMRPAERLQEAQGEASGEP